MGSRGLFREACGGICRLTGSSSPDNTQKLELEARLRLRTLGLQVPEGAPKKSCAKSWRADAPGLGYFI